MRAKLLILGLVGVCGLTNGLIPVFKKKATLGITWVLFIDLFVMKRPLLVTGWVCPKWAHSG